MVDYFAGEYQTVVFRVTEKSKAAACDLEKDTEYGTVCLVASYSLQDEIDELEAKIDKISSGK